MPDQPSRRRWYSYIVISTSVHKMTAYFTATCIKGLSNSVTWKIFCFYFYISKPWWREQVLPAGGEVHFSDFQSSFVNHGFFVYLVATLLHKIKQLLQVQCPRVENVIAILCCLETDYFHWPVNLCHQCLGHYHVWKMLLSFLNWKGQKITTLHTNKWNLLEEIQILNL